MALTYFDNVSFQRSLVSLLIKDKETLKLCQSVIVAKDFRPRDKDSTVAYARWLCAQLSLEHFERYRQPIRELLDIELRQYCQTHNFDSSRTRTIVSIGRKLRKKKVLSPAAITDKVLTFKREKIKQAAVEELITLQSNGKLSDEKWLEISRKAVEVISHDKYTSTDYFGTFQDRAHSRKLWQGNRFPLLLIPEFDEHSRAIARGHLGLILAPYKRGKSLALIHIARAYVLQNINVLYITLEDPEADVLDRFDASITHLPIKNLAHMPKTFKKRFRHFKRMLRARMRVKDGTDVTVTVQIIKSWIEEERSRGFNPDAIIVDYDDELVATKRHPDRRIELAEIYRDMRKAASEGNQFWWTAAQTQRGTSELRVISGDKLADDVSKARKVACALSLGKGDWGDDSIYLHVAAHKFDSMHWGTNIATDKARMMFYSPEKTRKYKLHPPKPVHEDDND